MPPHFLKRLYNDGSTTTPPNIATFCHNLSKVIDNQKSDIKIRGIKERRGKA